MTTTHYPIDFDTYEIGDVIGVDVIEHAFGVKRDDRRYRLSQLAMANAAERAFMERGQLVTIKSQGDDVAILSHPEASIYNERRFKSALSSMVRCHARHTAVPMDQLPDDESRTRHTITNMRNGRTLQAAKQARRLPVQIEEQQRITPGRKR